MTNTIFNKNTFIKKLRIILKELTGPRMYQIYKLPNDESFSVDIIKDGRVHPVMVYYWDNIEKGTTSLDDIKKDVEQALQGVFIHPAQNITFL